MKKILFIIISCISYFMSFSQSTSELIGKADELVKTQDFDQAIAIYSQAIKLDSTNAEFYYKRGFAYFYAAQYLQALPDFSQASILFPDHPDIYFMKARIESLMGDYDAAIYDYAKVIDLDSNYVQAYVHRAYAFLSTKQNTAAFIFFTKAINKDPNQPADVYYARGYTYQESGAYWQALEDYKKAIELNPDLAGAYQNSGNCYYALKDYEKALDCYGKSEKLQPDDSTVYYARGFVYLDTGFTEKACEEWNKALNMGNKYVQKYIDVNCGKK